MQRQDFYAVADITYMMHVKACLECSIGMDCEKHSFEQKFLDNSKKRRSERLSLSIIKTVLQIIDHSKKSRQQILDEVALKEIKATKHQIFKLLDNWVENGEIKKIKTLTDGRRVFYYKNPFNREDQTNPISV
ncbi:MAG: hypothetical protein HeimC2_06700 [Candidatus Heimdallarchaeota archaeon LC_2]|nr:MAG: hypothetical protein HeimC2_06700 [Candidatus Heimdallarchaeota archaeon LC_2]